METQMTDMPDHLCAQVLATRPVLEQIANKWSVLILTVVCTKPSRFNVLKRRLGGITHKALTEALRRLERNGLVARRVITSSPIAVEYSITPLGRSLQEPFAALFNWSVLHQQQVEQAQQAFDALKAEREHTPAEA